MDKVRVALEAGDPVRSVEFTEEEHAALHEFHFITAKPILYIANVAEDGLENNPLVDIVRGIADAEEAEVVVVSNKIESDIAELEDEERAEFLQELGLSEPGLNRVIRAWLQTVRVASIFYRWAIRGSLLDYTYWRQSTSSRWCNSHRL